VLKNNLYEKLDSHKWGGSGIERETFEFIMNILPQEATIVEIGAGYCSTKIFSEFYKLYSIENNKSFINLFNSNYIYAPIINGWYDRQIVKESLPSRYDLIFVDGPLGEGNRGGFLDNIDLFQNVPIMVHDTYRKAEHNLAEMIGHKLNKKVTFHHNVDFFAYIR